MSAATRRAAAVGALLGALCVVAAVVAATSGGLRSEWGRSDPLDGPILVALVLPDDTGMLSVRSLDRYERVGTGLRLTSVDPLTSATVPGTSATTLAEAYSFGGGEGLVTAYSQKVAGTRPGWIVVGPSEWLQLMGSNRVALRITSPVEVFDGASLYSYRPGSLAVAADEVPPLMSGAAYLPPGERASLRASVGDSLARALGRGYMLVNAGLKSSLTPEELGGYLGD